MVRWIRLPRRTIVEKRRHSDARYYDVVIIRIKPTNAFSRGSIGVFRRIMARNVDGRRGRSLHGQGWWLPYPHGRRPEKKNRKSRVTRYD